MLPSNVNHMHAEIMITEGPVEAVHVAILVMLTTVTAVSLCMIIQYANRYHKYQRASVTDDITDTDYSETMFKGNFAAVISHETSTSTLISEIIPLRKLNKEKESSQNELVKTVDIRRSLSHSESGDISISHLKGSHLTETKESAEHLETTVHIFQAQVHTGSEPEDNEAENHQSPNFSNEEAITEQVYLMNSLHQNHHHHRTKKLSPERRPSLCTRISVSSSISPTLSFRTNIAESPNLSLRGSTLKRVKDIRNQERLMVGSDFSLTGQDTDLEMDYYDYNVQNTSAVPGSYLGMDPAYCVWIPPFAPGQWVDNGCDYEDEDDNDDADADSFSSVNCTMNQEMRISDMDCDEAESRSETSHSEKFQKECKNKEKERFKRLSNASTVSSSNKTLIKGNTTSEDDLLIKKALLPDSPINIQRAYIIKESVQHQENTTLQEKDDFKFADDDDDGDEDNDSGTAYDSVSELGKVKKEYGGVSAELYPQTVSKVKVQLHISESRCS